MVSIHIVFFVANVDFYFVSNCCISLRPGFFEEGTFGETF